MSKKHSNQIGSSLKWSSAGEIIAKLIVPISNMILARILVPEDFGILASVNMIISFVDLFTDSGFAKYLIQSDFKDDDEIKQYANVAFWTNFAVSVFLYLLIVLFRDRIAKFAGSPDYGLAIAVASFQLLITSFSSIQTALFKRFFDFKTLFFRRIAVSIVPLVVTVPIAYFSRSYWALIIGSLVSALLNAVLLTLKSSWRPRLYYSIDHLKKMFSFSVWSLAEAVAYWLTNWIDVFIIGTAFSAFYLGLYKSSLNMVNSIMALVKASIIPVLFSSLSRLKHCDSEFKDVYFALQRLTSYVLIPMGAGLFLFRKLATSFMFGAGWAEASNIVGAWALAMSFFILFEGFNGEAYKAKGIPKVLFVFQIVYLVIMVPICFLAKNRGFWYMVYIRAATIGLEVIIGLFFMNKYIGFAIRKMIANVVPGIMASAVMCIGGYFVKQVSTSITWQMLSIVICILIYGAVLVVFFRRQVIDDCKIFKKSWSIR